MTYPISVKAVLVHQDRVLLLLNERGEWDLPGGRPDPGEDHRAALKREVQEEAGLAVEIGAALHEHLFEVLPGRFVRILPFACRLVGSDAVALSHEHLDTRWLAVEALGDGVVDGHRLPAGYLSAARQAIATARLAMAGLDLPADCVAIEGREDRWLARLPDERMAWFPADARGRERLARERRVLRLLGERCAFRVPRVLFEGDQGWDLRAIVPGLCDPWGLYRRTLDDRALARRIGAAIGAILVDQHSHVGAQDVSGWLPIRPDWPEPSDWMRQRLPRVVDDRGLLADIHRTLDIYDAVTVEDDDKVLVHGDLGLHNIAVDPASSEVRGVFDYGGASWSDRHNDFRYLLFHHEHDDALEAALEVYEPAVGRSIRRDRVLLCNAACAISFLALRAGRPAEQKSCGRTLAEDLVWVRGILARL